MQKYKILFFLTAVSQLVSTYFTNFSGGSNFSELLITPAGYTFVIWGAITMFTSIYSFYHLFFDRHFFSRNFYLLLSFVYICYTLWLLAAERNLFLATVIVVLAMLVSLVKVFHEAAKDSYRGQMNKIFLLGGTGMYLGWVSIASVLNIAIYIFSFGFDIYSDTGIYLQMFIVLLASLSASYVLYKSNFSKVVLGTHWWAFVGLLIGLLGRNNTYPILIFTIFCVVGLNIFFIYNQKLIK
jgi:hypothetical protein